MRRTIVSISMAAVAATGAALSLTALPAAADPAAGRAYGQHVATCAHEMGGFSGDHNPGVHRGITGWDGSC